MTVSKEEEVTVKFPGFCFQKLKPRLTTPDTWKEGSGRYRDGRRALGGSVVSWRACGLGEEGGCYTASVFVLWDMSPESPDFQLF